MSMKQIPRKSMTAPNRRMQGVGLVKLLLIIPGAFVLLLLLAVGFFEGRKAYWDYRVKQMCEKDGGLKVFEPITISHSQFLAWGGQEGIRGVPIPHESENRSDILVFRRTADETLRSGSPEVRRDTTEFVRRSDRKVLGKYVYFARRGGDFPTIAHESSFGCKVTGPVTEQVILIEREAK
ncbi:MAG: hypothetical protein ROZ00_02690 [Denitratisoma sp.]|nr:hypothetical protein [Denitratisoma sp.]